MMKYLRSAKSTPFLFPQFFLPQTSDIIYDIVPSTNITR
jgi:hypothetical protein